MKSYLSIFIIILNIGAGIMDPEVREDFIDLLNQIKYNLVHIFKETVRYIDISFPADQTTDEQLNRSSSVNAALIDNASFNRSTEKTAGRSVAPSAQFLVAAENASVSRASDISIKEVPNEIGGDLHKEKEREKTATQINNDSGQERCTSQLQDFRSTVYNPRKAMVYIECALYNLTIDSEPTHGDVRTLETVLELLYPLMDMMNLEDKDTTVKFQMWIRRMFQKADQLGNQLDQEPDQTFVPFFLVVVFWAGITFVLIAVGFLMAWRSMSVSLVLRSTDRLPEYRDTEYLETRLSRNLLNRFSDRGSRFKKRSVHAESANTREPRSTHYQSFRSFGHGRNSHATPRCELDREEGE